MLCTDQPYNEDDNILITKQSCYNYTFTNKSLCVQTIVVTRLTDDGTPLVQTYTLPALGSVSVVLPGDGMYSVKGTGGCTTLTVIDTKVLPVDVMHIAVFELPANIDSDLPISGVRDTVNNITAYNSGIDGFASLSTPANMLTALNAYGAGTGVQYVVQLKAPTDSFTGGWDAVYPDTTNWRLMVGYIGADMNLLQHNTGDYSPVAKACAYFANQVDPQYPFVTQTTVNTVNIMTPPAYYSIAGQAGFDAWRSLVAGELSNYGTIFDVPGSDEVAGVILSNLSDECPDVEATYAKGTEVQNDIAWCTTLWEWCALWNCVQTKMAEWLCCTDPCNPSCDTAPFGSEWLDRVQTLTMWGIMPLLTEHHLWQFGNLSDDTGANLVRLQPTINLWKQWYKMVNNCGCPGSTPCGNCAGGGTLIPQSPIINPVSAKNNGGCGCGC